MQKISELASIAAIAWGLTACTSIVQEPLAEQASVDLQMVELQILALNDYHGALETPSYEFAFRDGEASRSQRLGGAARLAAALEVLRQGNDHTITVAAGDMIGASPIISSRFLDEPAIGTLNRAGLEIASVGNHEFDRGIAELRRIQHGGCDKHTPREPCQLEQFAGAQFAYLAGNTVDHTGETLFPGTALRQFGEVTVGFIGLTLEGTPELVAPSAVAGWTFLDEAQAANSLAKRLTQDGADLIVLLIHEGAQVDPKLSLVGCPALSGPIVSIIERLDPSIGLIVSGHTHQAYVCQITTADKTARLLTSAGAQGSFVTDIRLEIDPQSGAILRKTAANVPITGEYGEDTETAAYVENYASAVAAIAERPIGPYSVASNAPQDASTCRDTSAQRLVADAHAAAAAHSKKGDAQFALMNTGGVRTQLPPGAQGTLTFGEIYEMQPFGNTIQTFAIDGALLKEALEGQFCGNAPATVCRSLLIPSARFAYRFDLDQPEGQRIVSATLDGAAIDPNTTYRVAINNFIAKGGDGFAPFSKASLISDIGFDLDILENYLGAGAQIGACGRVSDQTGL